MPLDNGDREGTPPQCDGREVPEPGNGCIEGCSVPFSRDSALSLCLLFQAHLPFAVIGSTEELKIGNKMMKARQYPWGTVQGE